MTSPLKNTLLCLIFLGLTLPGYAQTGSLKALVEIGRASGRDRV